MRRANRFPSIRQLARLPLVISGLCGCAADATNAADASTEYQVKAAFLLNFIRFVSPPAGEFAGPGATLNICVMGDDPFGPVLDQIVEGESVDGRKIQVFRVSRRPSVACQVVFIARDEKDKSSVGTELGPVRFEINESASDKTGLKIGSKLLSIARSVERR
jgi:hypothetical protein